MVKHQHIKVLVFTVVMTLVPWGMATTYTVTTVGDGIGSCNASNECDTLREAINAAANGDTIDVSGLAGQTITLTGDLPEITVDNLTIDGGTGAKVTIDGGGNHTIFDHRGGGTFEVNNLVVTGGTGVVDGVILGGAIFSENGNVTVTNSIISGNTADLGGGILSLGTVIVINSAISGNEAGNGGGIWSRGTITVTNSTVSGNQATTGGGIMSRGATAVTLENSLVLGNDASNDPEIFTDVGITSNSSAYGFGAGESEGDAFVGKVVADVFTDHQPATAGNPTTNGDYTLIANSPAIDAGDDALAVDNNGSALTVDLAGNARCQGTSVDMGAYEFIDMPCSSGDDAPPIINPNPDMQIRNGATLEANSITSRGIEPLYYGPYKRGQAITLDFLVRNPGAQTLEVGELLLPSFLSVVGEPLPETLASFASVLLTLEVNTSSAGQFTGEVSLSSNDPDANENPFTFDVVVTVSDEPANALYVLPGVALNDITISTGQQDVVLLSFKPTSFMM
ncbi:MAG: right-handed parallel beta-helix repeat-containing protein [Deinococcota bacterium]